MPIRKPATYFQTALAICCMLALTQPQPVLAQEKVQASALVNFQISPGPLDSALNQFAAQSRIQVMYSPELVAGMTSAGLAGQYSRTVALKKLLADSHLTWDAVNPSMYVLKRMAATNGAGPGDNRPRVGRNAALPDRSGEEVEELDKIVVVGSRMGSSPVESALPMKMITRQEIESIGASTISQVLSYLPEVSVSNAPEGNIGQLGGTIDGVNANAGSVQLRGLPLGTTLILINGRRAGESSALAESGQYDLGTIPLALVERIEVLPAGASAVYGGDGLAGVINIVLRDDVSGFDVRLRNVSAKGYDESSTSLMWGKSWQRGSIIGTATWGKNNSLSDNERALTSDPDFRRFGGFDRRSTSFAYPATIYSLEGCPTGEPYCFVPLDQRGNLPGINSPFASVPLGQDGTGLSPSDFVATAGQLTAGMPKTNFINSERKHSIGVTARLDITSATEAFGEFSYSKKSLPAREVGLYVSGGEYGSVYGIVPASNYYNPFGVDVGVSYYNPSTNMYLEYENTNIRGSIGLKGKLGRWDWEASGTKASDKSTISGAYTMLPEALLAALSSSNPETALNVFGSSGAAPGSEQLLQSLFSDTDRKFRSDMLLVTAFASGPLVKLPAGDLKILLGGEYQRNSVSTNVDGSAGVDGTDRSTSLFTEARVPILRSNKESGREIISLTSAVRTESMDRADKRATTTLAGVEIRPFESFLLRATYSTAVKPVVNYQAQSPSFSFASEVRDPLFGNQFVPFQYRYGGGTPDGLLPEASRSRTLGATYSTDKGLRASVTIWENNLSDRFVVPNPQFLVDNESSYPTRVLRDPVTGQISEIDARLINVSRTDINGIDAGISKNWSLSRADLVASVSATYTHKYEEQILPTSDVENKVGVLGLNGWAPRWKIVPRLSWSYGIEFSATATGRFVSKYRDTARLTSGPNAGNYPMLGEFWMVDLVLDFGVAKWIPGSANSFGDSRLRIGAMNLFNKLPDFCNSCGYGFDATQYDIRGRAISAELALSF